MAFGSRLHRRRPMMSRDKNHIVERTARDTRRLNHKCTIPRRSSAPSRAVALVTMAPSTSTLNVLPPPEGPSWIIGLDDSTQGASTTTAASSPSNRRRMSGTSSVKQTRHRYFTTFDLLTFWKQGSTGLRKFIGLTCPLFTNNHGDKIVFNSMLNCCNLTQLRLN